MCARVCGIRRRQRKGRHGRHDGRCSACACVGGDQSSISRRSDGSACAFGGDQTPLSSRRVRLPPLLATTARDAIRLRLRLRLQLRLRRDATRRDVRRALSLRGDAFSGVASRRRGWRCTHTHTHTHTHTSLAERDVALPRPALRQTRFLPLTSETPMLPHQAKYEEYKNDPAARRAAVEQMLPPGACARGCGGSRDRGAGRRRVGSPSRARERQERARARGVRERELREERRGARFVAVAPKERELGRRGGTSCRSVGRTPRGARRCCHVVSFGRSDAPRSAALLPRRVGRSVGRPAERGAAATSCRSVGRTSRGGDGGGCGGGGVSRQSASQSDDGGFAVARRARALAHSRAAVSGGVVLFGGPRCALRDSRGSVLLMMNVRLVL